MHCSLIDGPTGPLLPVIITESTARKAAIAAAGGVIAPPRVINLLVDTGASITVLDLSVIAQLSLQAVGAQAVHTPTTGSEAAIRPSYDVDLIFTGHHAMTFTVRDLLVIASDFSAQSIGGLLGRDALAFARLTYSGVDKFAYLSF